MEDKDSMLSSGNQTLDMCKLVFLLRQRDMKKEDEVGFEKVEKHEWQRC
jgi:hypothetical protein